ncbi:TnsD family Tn7-like transposition protein [Microbulbifer sp. CnH-101-E]|uniref:TnsD family Tn7-like transposition protein n=1 Tax=unclassified Microbulbifer TaxID=2619833 RepID=UPI0040394B1A
MDLNKCLLPPLPDELLLGRLIRHVTILGEDTGEFTKKVFGSSRASVHPFLTSGLAHFAEFFGEDAKWILFNQTLAPLFFFYLPEHADRLESLLLANDGARALRESQLPSFASGNSMCLKWCTLCARQDIVDHGVSYWHRAHQIPGVTACAAHYVLLQKILLKDRQRIISRLLPTYRGRRLPATDIEVAVAEFGRSLMELFEKRKEPLNLALIYRHRLAELGFITNNGRVRRQSLQQQFSLAVESFRGSTCSPLPKGKFDFRYLSELLKIEGSHHPFRHLLFGAWLFKEARELLTYRPVVQSKTIKLGGDRNKKIEKQCLALLGEGRSMAEVYRLTGKSRCYLKRLATRYGISVNLKPKKLTPSVKLRIIRLARACLHRSLIAERCGIGIGSVEQVISSEPGLVTWRRRCHWESKRRRSRLRILRYRLGNPSAIRRDIKKACSEAFFWLYLNDLSWLEFNLPPPQPVKGRTG